MAKAEGDAPTLEVSVLGLSGEVVSSWAGSAETTVAELKRCVAEQIGQHVLRVALAQEGEELVDGETLAESKLPEKATLQLIVNNKLAEEKWEELQQMLSALNYDNRNTKEIVPVAVECLELRVRPVNELARTIRDVCEEAGSMTEMPPEWFAQLAAHPDSKCDTPAQFHNELLHCAIFHNIRLADKPFFQAGPHTDKVDYPEWRWRSRIGGTPLDMAARKLETSLESPPHWGSRAGLPKSNEELDVAQENFMLLLKNGFKMSRVAAPGRSLTVEEGIYDPEMVWKLTLLERTDPPYDRYAAIHAAWREAGVPEVVIPAHADEAQ